MTPIPGQRVRFALSFMEGLIGSGRYTFYINPPGLAPSQQHYIVGKTVNGRVMIGQEYIFSIQELQERLVINVQREVDGDIEDFETVLDHNKKNPRLNEIDVEDIVSLLTTAEKGDGLPELIIPFTCRGITVNLQLSFRYETRDGSL